MPVFLFSDCFHSVSTPPHGDDYEFIVHVQNVDVHPDHVKCIRLVGCTFDQWDVIHAEW